MTPEDSYEARCTRVAVDVETVLKRRVTRFRTMCAEHGSVEATKRLIHAQRPSDTFSDLWMNGRLDLTVEAVVLTEREWDALFTDVDRKAAQKRSRDHEWPLASALPD